jgi:hypothetical protein
VSIHTHPTCSLGTPESSDKKRSLGASSNSSWICGFDTAKGRWLELVAPTVVPHHPPRRVGGGHAYEHSRIETISRIWARPAAPTFSPVRSTIWIWSTVVTR